MPRRSESAARRGNPARNRRPDRAHRSRVKLSPSPDENVSVPQDKRRFRREKHRVGCEYRSGGVTHQGILADLSARGVFIQSSMRPEEGDEIEVILREPALGEIHLHGRVRRVKGSHRAAASVVSGGFGVELDTAPEGFFQLLVNLGLG